MSIIWRMPEPDKDPEATKEARAVAREICQRNYQWTDGYNESFAEYVDRLGYFSEDKEVFLSGSKELSRICDRMNRDDPIWSELGLNPDRRSDVSYCCERIMKILSRG